MNRSTPPPRPTRPNRDHVSRLVRQHFAVVDGELRLGNLSVKQLVDALGTPLFVYDHDVIQGQIDKLRSLLPDRFDLYYSIKANPNAAILRHFVRAGCGLEVASQGEISQALAAGCSADRVIFAGPGKTESELAAALDAALHEIHVESLEEAYCISELAQARGVEARVAIRVNPIGGAGGAMQMSGRAAPFGIDEEDLDRVLTKIRKRPGLCVVGIHLFMATQILDASTLIEHYRHALALARRVAAKIPGPLQTIDFGGGLGTPYFAHEDELNLEELARGLDTIDQQMGQDELLKDTRAIMEPGRFLVSESGVYLTRVTRVKRSRGKVFAIVDGGMHHHLAASGNLGQTIKRNFPVAVVNKMHLAATETTEVVGPLCTPLDMLARRLDLPPVEAGDIVGVFQSGAYARTSSPLGFLSHDSPAEVLVSGGVARLIRRRGAASDLLRDQCETVVIGQSTQAVAK